MATPTVVQIVVTPPEKPCEPPRVATASALHVMNDLVVVSFAHPNLFAVPKSGSPYEAPTFAQVAFTRSAFSQFLQNALTALADLPDRDTLGWQNLKALVNKELPE